jgi:ribosomal protein S18 acetylase RimI-like enzyme
VSAGQDLAIVFDPTEAGANTVRAHLDAFNFARTGVDTWYPVNMLLRNDRGEILGGVIAIAWGGWLAISNVWVDEALRGKGWATRLMDQAEAMGREKGCRWACLDTHSFQARPFYEKRGYEVFGTLDDYPAGHQKFFLRKKL